MKNPIDVLAAWLDQPVYTEGVRLYEQLIGADFYWSLFKTGADDYNRETLQSKLEAKYQELLSAQSAQRAAYPQSLALELTSAGLLMDERTVIKEKMRALYLSGVRESAELKTHAYRILSIKDELDRIYGRRTFFDNHHFLPESASVPEADDPTRLLRKRNNLRTYISKYSAELEQCFEAGRRAKIQKRLDDFKNQLHQLDNQLQQLTTS